MRGGGGLAGSEAHIFVSYKAEDRARVKPLVAALEAEGFNVWWDAHIDGGTNWRRDIEEHLDAAKCVIVAWTKRSVGPEGEFVRDEARRARRRGTYVPVLIDPVEPPLGFGEVQALSLRGWKGDPTDSRYVALANAVRNRLGGDAASAREVSSSPDVSRRVVLASGAGAAAIAAGAGGWLLLKPSSASASGSIAVLPFNNLSGDANQAYFADGIADEIRSALTRIGGLTVIGSTSSAAVRNDDARIAAQKLGVANILTGSVRQSPSTIRISAELIDGRTGADRWTQDYDRQPGDAIKIQTDIAEKVATALRGALGLAARAAIELGGTSDTVAQDLILQCRKLLREGPTLDSLKRIIALADQAISRDPKYADAYVVKSGAMGSLAVNFTNVPADVEARLGQADAAARKAAALVPRLGSAYAAIALIASFRLDFPSALQTTLQSIALSPNDPAVLGPGAITFTYLGRAVDALRACNQAIALDPLNGRNYRVKAEVLLFARRYADAIEAGRKALQLSPLSNARIIIGDALLLLGRAAEARTEYEAITADNPFRSSELAILSARTGDRAEAARALAQMKQKWGPSASYQYAQILAQMGNTEGAFAELNNAVQTKDPGLSYLKVDPFLDPIRGDPRYPALVKRLNFP